MSDTEFRTDHRLDPGHQEAGMVSWRSPSNIALVKYWGKRAVQLPRNANFSLTLSVSHTDTRLSYRPRGSAGSDLSLGYFFEGERHEAFESRVIKFLEGIKPYFPWLDQIHMDWSSTNSFPHSSGIASSASSMSAIALCLCSVDEQLFGKLKERETFFKKASFIARLGSGSASRSVYPIAAAWGTSVLVPASSDLYAVDIHTQIHPSLRDLRDTICIVSRHEKSVSSSAGHALMEDNPYADLRYSNARRRMQILLQAMSTGDWERAGSIIEQEALELHALMMTSMPSYLLMESGTTEILHRVRAYRAESGHAVYFTLDAGPNVHLLYPSSIEREVRKWISTEIAPLCAEGAYIHDETGRGPEVLSDE